jgi:cytochrome c-type biogenesis protein CcmE
MSSSVKVLITIIVAICGVSFLAYSSVGDVEYYSKVDEVVTNPADWLKRKTIQVHGIAQNVPSKGTIVAQTVTRKFNLTLNGKRITVVHDGVVPDTFKEEAETVVKGTLTQQPDGSLLFTTVGGEQGIMAKCPSKYEGKKGTGFAN